MQSAVATPRQQHLDIQLVGGGLLGLVLLLGQEGAQPAQGVAADDQGRGDGGLAHGHEAVAADLAHFGLVGAVDVVLALEALAQRQEGEAGGAVVQLVGRFLDGREPLLDLGQGAVAERVGLGDVGGDVLVRLGEVDQHGPGHVEAVVGEREGLFAERVGLEGLDAVVDKGVGAEMLWTAGQQTAGRRGRKRGRDERSAYREEGGGRRLAIDGGSHGGVGRGDRVAFYVRHVRAGASRAARGCDGGGEGDSERRRRSITWGARRMGEESSSSSSSSSRAGGGGRFKLFESSTAAGAAADAGSSSAAAGAARGGLHMAIRGFPDFGAAQVGVGVGVGGWAGGGGEAEGPEQSIAEQSRA